jgi:hypothetical protein
MHASTDRVAPAREPGAQHAPRPPATLRDIGAGLGGLTIMALAAATPYLRGRRQRWGVTEEVATRRYPGDGVVAIPTWMWTHGVEVDARASAAWPWVAQIGADRGGFYSYAWLENLAGCNLHNAEVVHPEWAVRAGQSLVLHPDVPPLDVTLVVPGSWFLARTKLDVAAKQIGRGWVEASWLFYVEPLGARRCRVISRYRCATAPDLRTRLAFGPTLIEPISFAMDRKMLLGIKRRAEHTARA